jgi:hypothetical protein
MTPSMLSINTVGELPDWQKTQTATAPDGGVTPEPWPARA